MKAPSLLLIQAGIWYIQARKINQTKYTGIIKVLLIPKQHVYLSSYDIIIPTCSSPCVQNEHV